ncbi:MAG: helix-turn-helix domain-containing protein [Actinomycetota bacterium]|nr:helix-turn-helix domain-containing protein [Actinomycetota bacterium]
MPEENTDGGFYTPTEAALILRVTPTRVRQLLQDGELEGERDEAGHWLIPARAVHERLERLRRESFLEAVGYDLSSVREMPDLVEALREQVEMLRVELEEAHAANRENRRIIAALTSRIPAIEAPQETRESPETAKSPGPREKRPFTDEERVQEPAQPRSWWRRLFGG